MKTYAKRSVVLLVGLLTQSVVASTVIWSEGFEGAALGATSVGNDTLDGTVIGTGNSAEAIVVDASTDPAAAAAFSNASGQFIRLSIGTGESLYAAIRSAANPIEFSQLSSTNVYTMSFDMYIPSDLPVAVGDFQPRFKLTGSEGNGAILTTHATDQAGQYHVVYTGYISDFIATDIAEARPFIGIDQNGSAATDFMYLDNIHFEIGGDSSHLLPPLNEAYFASLKAGTVTSTELVKWQQFGPGMSGYIDLFWINNGDPNAMYDALDMGNCHVTLNGGKYWHTFKDTDGNGLPGDVVGIEFSHQDADFGFMMAKEGMYSTSDRGVTWDFLKDLDTSNSQKHSILAVDPANDNNWYIGAGNSWNIKNTHYTQNGIVTEGNFSSGFILYTKNRWATWTKVSSPFPSDSSFSRIIVDPRNSDIVYASCQHGVYKSTNGGASWSLTPGTGLPHHQPRYMDSFYDASSGEFYLYLLEITHYDLVGSEVVTSGGVFRSDDGASTWENITGDLAIDMTEIGYWGYRSKYYRAVAYWQDSTITSSDIQNNYNLPTSTFSQFHQMAVDPTNKDRIYLVHNFKHDYSFPPGNIWMTENGGTNWYAAAREGNYWKSNTDSAYWGSRTIQPMGINTTFAHVEREHNGSGDHLGTGPRFVKCNQRGEVFTAFAQQVMRSTNQGDTWEQIDDDETEPGSGHWVGRGNCNLPGETFCLDTATPGIYLWGSGEHGLWRSTDDGDLVYPGAIAVEQLTGQSISGTIALSISTIATDPQNRNHVYMIPFRQTGKGEFLFSDDGGDSWTTRSTPINFPGINDVLDSRSLMIDHQNSNTIYFCIPFSEWEKFSGSALNNARKWTGDQANFGQGIYKSTDGGYSWSTINNGLPTVCSVYRMAMDPVNPQILYAALNETHTGVAGGLYKTTNGGANWNAVTLPSGVISVNNVKVSEITGDIYIATGTQNDSGKTGGGFVSQDGGATWNLLFDMPYVRHFVPSKADANVIAVNVDSAQSIGKRNPGAYVSVDGGANWHKINNRHGQPEGIRKIEPDPHDKNILWMSNNGTGFFRADISPLFDGQPNAPFYWDWMREYGLEDRLADSDDDGFNDQLEFIADTDPTDPNDRFKMVMSDAADSTISIGFESALSRLYTVETTDDLTGGWQVLTNDIKGTGQSIDLNDPISASNRFYRIKVELD